MYAYMCMCLADQKVFETLYSCRLTVNPIDMLRFLDSYRFDLIKVKRQPTQTAARTRLPRALQVGGHSLSSYPSEKKAARIRIPRIHTGVEKIQVQDKSRCIYI